MAKLKNPLLSLGAVGRLAKDIVFTRRRKVDIVEKKPIPKDVKSLLQLNWRHMYQKAVLLWHALSAAEKKEWESLARPKHMTGFAWFISQALKPNPGLYLPLQGGTMAGDINMDKHLITNLPAPTDSQHPVTLVYLLSLLNFLSLTDTPASYAGDAGKAATVKATEDGLEFSALVGGYTEGARAYHSANQNIPNTTWTILALNSERYDTDTIHDLVTNNSRLTCKTAGKYIIVGLASFATAAGGERYMRLLLNGATEISYFITGMSPGNEWRGVITSIYDLAVNDYVELSVFQTSGGGINVPTAAKYTPEFMMQRVG